MTKLDVSLTEDLKAFLEQQAAAGGYRSAAAYVEDVLRQLWKHKARGMLEAKVMEGINSGPPIEVTPDTPPFPFSLFMPIGVAESASMWLAPANPAG